MGRKKIQKHLKSKRSVTEINCETDASQIEAVFKHTTVEADIKMPLHCWIYNSDWKDQQVGIGSTFSNETRRRVVRVVPLRKTSDRMIRSRLIFGLFIHPQIVDTHINVWVEKGVVVLSGSVPDQRQRLCAENIVAHEAGVTTIDNQLEVIDKATGNGNHRLKNKIVAENVIAILSTDDRIRGCNLKVTVKKGVAELNGAVNTHSARITAQRVAMKIPGVNKVENHLVVGVG